jgi:hypothetical protein
VVIAKGSDEREQIWNKLLADRSEIRHYVVEKYSTALGKVTK